MVQITDKPQHDPVADLPMMDAYARWSLLAAEEILGEASLNRLLRKCKLDRLIDHYPPAEMTAVAGLTFADFANLVAAINIDFDAAAKDLLDQIGQRAAGHAIEGGEEDAFNLASLMASQRLSSGTFGSTATLLKVSLETIQDAMRALWQPALKEELHLTVENRGSKWAYVVHECPFCAGKQCDRPIGGGWTGFLSQATSFLTAQDFEFTEVECRAMGAENGVWEVSKTPKQKFLIEITDKPEPDAVADLYVVDAYLNWFLRAAEEIIGRRVLETVMRDVGMERFVGNYPANEASIASTVTFGDYARLNTGVLEFLERPGAEALTRIGRRMAQFALDELGDVFNASLSKASETLSEYTELSTTDVMTMAMENTMNGFRELSRIAGQEMRLRLESRGKRLAWIAEDCPFCAGKHAEEPICHAFTGILQESTAWLFGQEYDVRQTACRAMGAAACVWEVNKQPK